MNRQKIRKDVLLVFFNKKKHKLNTKIIMIYNSVIINIYMYKNRTFVFPLCFIYTI